MIDDWEPAIEFVLKMEGGAAGEHDPKDPGGYTKFGISSKAYPTVDIAALTLEEAKTIYHRDYWLTCRCDELPRRFAIAVFDMAVNQGVGKARRILQMTLDVDVDGVIGDKTVAAAHKASPRRFLLFLANRIAEYARTIAANDKLLVFAVNWAFRVLSLKELLDTAEPAS